MSSPHDDMLAVLRAHLLTAYSICSSEVRPEIRLQDLGLDSLDIVEVTATLMESVGGPGPLAALTEVQTVSDLIATVAITRTRESEANSCDSRQRKPGSTATTDLLSGLSAYRVRLSWSSMPKSTGR